MIRRQLQQHLIHLLKEYPAIAVLGPRQVGKTTLVKEIAKRQNKKPMLYLDIEKPSDVRKLTDAEAFFDLNKNNCTILDEVQLMPELFSILRPTIDEYRKAGRFILLGSASPNLMKGVSETLAGRIAYIELPPIGLLELPKQIKQNKHWFRGGFPTPLLAKSDESSIKWMDNFIKSYLERDLSLIFNIDFSSSIMKNFWSMLAHANGNIWNAEVFARSLGITATTVNRYADYLEAAFIIHRLPAFFINAKKRLVKAPKVYIRDSGLLHRLIDIQNTDDLLGNIIVGASWEGYVLEQIKQNLPTPIRLFYYRTHAGAECDIVLVKGIKALACIEVKFSNSPSISKGFFETIKDLKPKYKFIITPSSDEYPYKENILTTSLFKFLKNHLPNIK